MPARRKNQTPPAETFVASAEKILRAIAARERALREKLLAVEREVAQIASVLKQKKVKKFIDSLPL